MYPEAENTLNAYNAAGNVAYKAQGLQSAKPRELGASERTQGLVGGLEALIKELAVLETRIHGPSPAETGMVDTPPALGLANALSQAENMLRKALIAVEGLQRAI
jgi:hypothetical protein